MLCQYCGKNPAVIRVKTILDGFPSDFSLCAECAGRLGYGNLLIVMGAGLQDVPEDLLFGEGGDPAPLRCGGCGSSFADIVRTGTVGCAECYRTFADQLAPLIRRIHGGVTHRGKTAGESLPRTMPRGELSVMHRRLREAIESENFEQAAVLRDRIRKLEDGGR